MKGIIIENEMAKIKSLLRHFKTRYACRAINLIMVNMENYENTIINIFVLNN